MIWFLTEISANNFFTLIAFAVPPLGLCSDYREWSRRPSLDLRSPGPQIFCETKQSTRSSAFPPVRFGKSSQVPSAGMRNGSDSETCQAPLSSRHALAHRPPSNSVPSHFQSSRSWLLLP